MTNHMVTLTEELRKFVTRPEVVKVLATVSGDGSPNIGPKATTHVYDDESLAYIERTGKHHYENLQRGSRAAVACVDWQNREGYRFVGDAELHEQGEVYERICAKFFRPDRPRPKAAVRIKIREVYILTPGRAGEKLL